MSKDDFESVSVYIIPKAQLFKNVITMYVYQMEIYLSAHSRVIIIFISIELYSVSKYLASLHESRIKCMLEMHTVSTYVLYSMPGPGVSTTKILSKN